MSININRVFLIGRITADPELKKTADGMSVCRFSVAVNRKKAKESKEEKTDFINCVSFGSQAEFITKYFRKGSSIIVNGRIMTGSYDKDGTKVRTFDVCVENVEFGEYNRTDDSKAALTPTKTAQISVEGQPELNYIDDSDLPF